MRVGRIGMRKKMACGVVNGMGRKGGLMLLLGFGGLD